MAKFGPSYDIHLDESGLPSTVAHQATFDSATVSLPFDIAVADGSASA